MFERAIENEQLGKHPGADLLAVSFSANDYVGHAKGPDSPEVREISIATDRILGKQVVFACRSGRRSITASVAAQDAGYPYDCHLAGGIIAWKAAGLPTKT